MDSKCHICGERNHRQGYCPQAEMPKHSKEGALKRATKDTGNNYEGKLSDETKRTKKHKASNFTAKAVKGKVQKGQSNATIDNMQ